MQIILELGRSQVSHLAYKECLTSQKRDEEECQVLLFGYS